MFTVYLKSAGGTKKYFTEFETEAEDESFCREYDVSSSGLESV